MQKVVISLGGSVFVKERIDKAFIKKFRKLLNLKKRFIVVVGGGKICRFYQEAAKDFASKKELDEIGIDITRLNAKLLYFALRDIGAKLYPKKGRITIAFGLKPGRSTDYVAVKLAIENGIKEIVNLTNIDYVYDKDPHKYSKTKPIKELAWKDFFKLIPKKWKPGLFSPFDPVAARLASKHNLRVIIMNGQKLENLKRYLQGKKYEGTVIA